MKIIYDKLRHKEAHYVCILLINMLTATKFSTGQSVCDSSSIGAMSVGLSVCPHQFLWMCYAIISA